VTVRWRAPETTPPIIAALKDLPEPLDLVVLRRDDGEVELVPRSWQRLRIGREGPSLYEMARHTPGGAGPVPEVCEAVENAERLLAAYHPNFDDYAAEDRAELVRRMLKRQNRVSKSIVSLRADLEYAGAGRKGVPPMVNPTRDVSAALLNDVCGYGSLRVGQELGFSVPGVEALGRWLEDHPGVGLVVVDTLKKVRPRVPGNRSVYDLDYEALEPLVTLAAEHGVAILVVHHTRKAGAVGRLFIQARRRLGFSEVRHAPPGVYQAFTLSQSPETTSASSA
jgi:hypothetical protein